MWTGSSQEKKFKWLLDIMKLNENYWSSLKIEEM